MKKITCPSPCDMVFENEDEQILIHEVAVHTREVHPDMASGRSDEELKQMAKAMMEE